LNASRNATPQCYTPKQCNPVWMLAAGHHPSACLRVHLHWGGVRPRDARALGEGWVWGWPLAYAAGL
jgi:hypothetical protein